MSKNNPEDESTLVQVMAWCQIFVDNELRMLPLVMHPCHVTSHNNALQSSFFQQTLGIDQKLYDSYPSIQLYQHIRISNVILL